jgi:uncharacterized protein
VNKAAYLIKKLKLSPHNDEGGYFTETYRSPHQLPSPALPDNYRHARSLATAIYYLLAAGTFSRMHRLPGDEIFHFYSGDPVEMLLLHPSGDGHVHLMGSDIERGRTPQLVVPAGTWQGARLLAGGDYALMGTTMSPGFDYADFEAADGGRLCRDYPEFSELITALTR